MFHFLAIYTSPQMQPILMENFIKPKRLKFTKEMGVIS